MNYSVVLRKESVDRIETIITVHHFILLTIPGSRLLQPPTLQTPWIHGNFELRMTGEKNATGLLIGIFWKKSLSQ